MTIELPLTKGQVALIDDEFAQLAALKWCALWSPNPRLYYAKRAYWPENGAPRATMYLHRAVMEKHLGRKLASNELVNHIRQTDTLDCRLSNLSARPVTHAENQHWRTKPRNNKSGFKGVSFDSQAGKWKAQIRCGKHFQLGVFSNIGDAAIAYNIAALKLHGEFAVLNDLS